MSIFFKPTIYSIVSREADSTIFIGKIHVHIYTLNFYDLNLNSVKYLVARGEDTDLWHKRLGHASMRLLQKYSRKELARDFPLTIFESNKVCEACVKGVMKPLMATHQKKAISEK